MFASCVSFATALGCSQLPFPPYSDAGAGSDATPPMTYGPRALTPLPVDAVALAADDSGIYWTSPANELWVLPTGSPIPVRLASDSRVAGSCQRPTATAPLLATSYVFWVDSDRATLHRTRKDGTGDEQLAAVDRGDDLATDGSTVYWTESARGYVDGGYVDGNVVRSLPQEAPSGSPPATLLLSFDAISSMAVVGGIAYWTPYPNATVYYSDIWSAPVAALARGEPGTKLPGPQSPYALTGAGGDVLFGFFPNRFTTGLARRRPSDGAPQIVGTLPSPDNFLTGMAAADGWLLASTFSGGYGGCGQPPPLRLYAVAFADGTPKLVATGMRTPAIAAPQGIVFVDAARRLVALPTGELAKMISLVP